MALLRKVRAMTDGEFMGLVDYDWCVLPSYGMLHYPRSFEGDDEYVPVGGPGVTLCGRSGRLSIPGFLGRMSCPRCSRCCKAKGLPLGIGSPKNDRALRPALGLEP